MDKTKENIPKEYRNGDTRFTLLANIGGNLFTRPPKNLNHIHKDSNDLLSVIIILGMHFYGVETVCYDGKNMKHIEK